MSENMQLSILQPEFFSQEQTWMEFMEALSEVIQEHVRDPIKEIEDIRHIVESTDPEIIANTIKNIGFDLPADLIAHNANRLARSVYMLALFHERSGTSDLARSISYILGREVEVTNLWTNNYVDFYSAPQGALLADGGDWYKTTHISLGIEVVPSDSNLILPEGKTLADRLLAAYFEFAPINHVVHDFYYSIKAQASLGITGKVVVDKIDFLTIGRGRERVAQVMTLAPMSVMGGMRRAIMMDVRFDSDSCFDLHNPIYGYAPAGIDTHEELSQLTLQFSNKNNQIGFQFDIPDGMYGYVAYPRELGLATFTDSNIGIVGGWDGSGWPEDGSIGDSLGPIVVQRTFEGTVREWYLYRTDFPSHGEVEFDITFEHAGRNSSCDPILPDPPKEPEEPTDPEDPPGECYEEQIALLPVWGVADIGINTHSEILTLDNEEPNTNNRSIEVECPNIEDYAYFAHPIELGIATFVDRSTGIAGGWDGASWPDDGGIGEVYGPIVVGRLIGDVATDWYLYRTDFPGIGTKIFDVTFPEAGLVLSTTKTVCPDSPQEPECLSGYPLYAESGTGVDTDAELTAATEHVFDDTEDMEFSLTLDEGRYGYLAHPVELGIATITDISTGISGGWDGASWPIDGGIGDIYGPIMIKRTIAGNSYDWYLYRTDFPGFGEKTFTVIFPNSGLCVDTDIATPPGDKVPDVPENPEEPVPGGKCLVSALPRYGIGPAKITTEAAIEALAHTFDSTGNHTFTLNVPVGTYAWFAYPLALGLATFIDPSMGIAGGWDGATWPEDGSIGEEYGPIVVVKDGTYWLVHRTDFSSLSDITFDVEFSAPGLPVGTLVDCDPTIYPGGDVIPTEPVPETPVDPDPIPEGTCLVNGVPKYGVGNHLYDIDDIRALTHTSPTTRNHTFAMQVPEGEYGWFAYPAALGKATFIDSIVRIEGGWDGATWPEGSIEASSGPVLVTMLHHGEYVDWYLYRTDFPGLGQIQFEVMFENNGLDVGGRIDCNTDGVPDPIGDSHGQPNDKIGVVPIYGTGYAGIDTSDELESFLTNSLPHTGNQEFLVTVRVGEYGYFAHPAHLGVARFTDRQLDIEGGWDGATWPTDGTIGDTFGPLAVLRNTGLGLQTWYVYRTDFPGLGTKMFKVEFGPKEGEQPEGSRIVRITAPELTTDRPDIVSFTDTGEVIFAPVLSDTLVNITSTFNGQSDTIPVMVYAVGARLEGMRIIADTLVLGKESLTIQVEGTYSDGYIRQIDDAEIRVLSPYVLSREGYTLHTGNPPADDIIYIEARKRNQDGETIVAVHEVILKHVSTAVVVTDLSIIGPTEIIEGESQQYRAHAVFSDNTTRDVMVYWESSSPGLFVDQMGNASAGRPESDFTATLKATFQYRMVKYTATRNVLVRRSVLEAVSLTIQGPDRVVELSEAKYTAFVTWSNGAVSQSTATWTTSKFSIDSSGKLSTGSVGAGAISINVEARTRGLSATKVVAIYDTPIDVEHITIIGPENVQEGIVGQFSAFAHYSDGRDIEIRPQWSIINNPYWAQINADGQFTFNNPRTGIIEIRARFDNGIRVYTQTKPIVVVPKTSLISGLIITGLSEVLEGSRISLAATAMYEDGSTEVVAPIWGLRSADPLNDPEPAADIVSPGIVQGRSVDQDTVVIVTARYFKEIAEFPILVRNYDRPGPDVPRTHRIEGPKIVQAHQVASYSLLCMFDNNCDQEIALSNDWSLNVDASVAMIDESGFLRSMNGETVDLLVIADWEYAGHSIHAEYPVRIVATETSLGTLVMTGPDAVRANSITNYTLELFRAGQPAVTGTGETPPSANTEWWIDTVIPNVSINDTGAFYVGSLPEAQGIVIRARVAEGFHTIETSKLVTVNLQTPVFGTGPAGLNNSGDIAQYLTQAMPSIDSNQTFTVTANAGEYIYFASPVGLGRVMFLDDAGNSTLDGGMDGATWPDGVVGETYGPLLVRRVSGGVATDWYVYRSDFSGLGTVTMRAVFTAP